MSLAPQPLNRSGRGRRPRASRSPSLVPPAASCSSTRADPSSSRSTSSTTTTSREPAAVASTAAATCVAVSWPSAADWRLRGEHAGERLERRAARNSPTNDADDARAGCRGPVGESPGQRGLADAGFSDQQDTGTGAHECSARESSSSRPTNGHLLATRRTIPPLRMADDAGTRLRRRASVGAT